ncbi:MAG: hypothetical protein ACHQ1E_13190 [Ktedonobacterales bacterium]|jgi:hypothetical protein
MLDVRRERGRISPERVDNVEWRHRRRYERRRLLGDDLLHGADTRYGEAQGKFVRRLRLGAKWHERGCGEVA